MNRKIYKQAKDELLRIANENGGVLKPEDVVNTARDPENVLHRCFIWDDKKAAHEHRLDQARELIASIRYEYEVEEHTYAAPEWVRDPTQPSHDQGYVTVTSLRSNDELARDALINEFGRAAAHLQRAHEIAKALSFKPREVEKIIKRVSDLLGHANDLHVSH